MGLRIQRVLFAAAMISASACTAEPSESGPSNAGAGATTGGTGVVASGGVGGTMMNVAGMVGVAGNAGVGDVIATGGTFATNSGGSGGQAAGGSGGSQAGTGGTGVIQPGDQCKLEEAFAPLVPRDGEKCYEFLMHDGDGVSPFMVPDGESYNEFFFELPWGADEVATRYGQILDNKAVLHHWLGFTTTDGMPGQIDRLVSGTQLGESATLFGGWALGGCNVEFPADMGLQLDDPGKNVMFQWHHYNFSGAPQPDSTKIQICTVPTAMRKNIGSVTWLGTEDLGGNGFLGGGMPPGVESKFGGTCLNETAEPITIVSFLPHMHRIGKNMFTEVTRVGGATEVVFDEPFSNDYQAYYAVDPFIVLQPGDKIRAECTFFNNTPGNVAFGQSTDQEMCYQFAFSYPAGALDKPNNFSLIGATNTCWGD
jgi:hypothetical protein